MALEMKPSSRWWYARLAVNGKLRRFPLMETRGGKQRRIEIRGRRPESITRPEEGDAAFRESYRRALTAHDRLTEERLSSRTAEDLAQRIIEAKTGTRLDFVKVDAVAGAWAALPRKRAPSRQYIETSTRKLERFAAFIAETCPEVQDLAGVRSEHVRAFLSRETQRGISPRTWNVMLRLLKTVFAKLEPNAEAYRGYLKTAAFRDEETVHREPFTDEELEAILRAARDDDLLRGPLVTACCTAMRRGDCVLLKWSSVDMEAGFIEVRTSKTGETAEIPMLPLLREELERTERTESEYVFPEAARIHLTERHLLDRRLRAILGRAGFVDERRPPNEARDAKASLPRLSVQETRHRGLEAVESAAMNEAKRERMRAIFNAYMEGRHLPAIARSLGVSKSTVSLHLNEIESMIGAAVIRRAPAPPGPMTVRGKLHKDGSETRRRQRVSVRGWHSFRVSFVTRALAHGMPEELVRRVTGHTAVDVVRRHYFKPGRDEFRRQFEKAMPGFLMQGAKSREDQLKEIIQTMSAKTLKRDKARMLTILDGNA